MNPNNFKELGSFDLYLIIVSSIFFLLVIIAFSIFLQFIIKKIFKITPKYIFLLCCFGFYLLFLFNPLYEILRFAIFRGGPSYVALFLLFSTWIVVSVVVLYFNKSTTR